MLGAAIVESGFEDTPLASETIREALDENAPASRVGRYILLRKLGVGGMGAVYAAYDPKLNRRVALKLLRSDLVASLAVRRRLLREARSLARLSHANVVQVHDVDVSGHDVYVVMEFIQGESLRDFCRRATRPSWREILDAYQCAAEGLAAAHAKGLIHRDFKPANVLIDEDGSVKVVDFGLAAGQWSNAEDTVEITVDEDVLVEARRASEPKLAYSTAPHDSIAEDATLMDAALTASGVVMGTPAYMSPEQHEGGEIGVAADIYGFCASLYEGLYGVMPFDVSDIGWQHSEQLVLLGRKLERQLVPPPPETAAAVPAWLYQVIVRGLEPEPEDRWPSMDALIRALADDPQERRRARVRGLGLAFLLLCLAALALFGWTRRDARDPVCADAAHEMRGVWDAEVSSRVRENFQRSGRVHALETHDRLHRFLESYTGDWVAMKTQVCEATHVRKVQSPRLFDLRMQCLERHKGQVRALTGVLGERPDGEVIDKSLEAAMALPAIDLCADESALSAAFPPPEAPGDRQRLSELEARLALAEMLERAGRYHAGMHEAESVLVDSRSLGHPPMTARALYAVARLSEQLSDVETAESMLREAVKQAARAKDDPLIARIYISLLEVMGVSSARLTDAAALQLFAETAVERADDDLLRSQLYLILGTIRDQEGAYDQALSLSERSLAIRERILGAEDLATAAAHNQVGNALYSLGRFEDADRSYQRTLEIRENVLGPQHPLVASALNNLGIGAMELGDFERARAYHERALGIRRALFGHEHKSVASSFNNLGLVLQRMGEFERSRELHHSALTIREALLRPDHPLIASALIKLGSAHFAMGQTDHAAAYYQRARAIREAAHGEEHPEVALAMEHQAELALYRGQVDEARSLYERALAIMERTPAGSEHPYAVQALTGLAMTDTAAGHGERALPLLGQALTIQERAWGAAHHDAIPILMALAQVHDRRGDTREALAYWTRAHEAATRSKSGRLADCQFGLARALIAEHGASQPGQTRELARGQARELARQAARFFERIGHREKLARANQWLAAHP